MILSEGWYGGAPGGVLDGEVLLVLGRWCGRNTAYAHTARLGSIILSSTTTAWWVAGGVRGGRLSIS